MALPKYPTETWINVSEGYREGWSDVEVMRYLGVTKKTFYDMIESDPVAKEFVEMGRVLSEAWWMQLGRENVKRAPGQIFDGSLFAFITKNRFGWADKIQQVAEDPFATLSDDDVTAKLHSIMQDRAKDLGKTPAFSLLVNKKDG